MDTDGEYGKAAGIIPARYASQRFPGKPLSLIDGKPMVQHVYERACQAQLLDTVIIATDDRRILRASENFGAEVRLTSSSHNSGTERVAEVAAGLEESIIVNIQGDEPLIRGDMIDALVSGLQRDTAPMATLACRDRDLLDIKSPGIVKIAVSNSGYALYFSRSPLPYGAENYFWRHIGVYAFQRNFLLEFAGMKPTRLERMENLEQLRALENSVPIKVIETDYLPVSVDYPEDISKVEQIIKKGTHD